MAALATVVVASAATVVGTATPASAISAVRELSVGFKHTCAVTLVYDLFCWGDNSSGQLGLGDTDMRKKPARVPGAGKWLSVAAGRDHTCAIRRDSTIYCWGKWATEDGGISLEPVKGSKGWKQVTAGWDHTCGIKTDGTAHCWGSNQVGQAGLPYPPKDGDHNDLCRKRNFQWIPCTLREIKPPWFEPNMLPVIAWDFPRIYASYDPRSGIHHDPDFIDHPALKHFRLAEKWSSIDAEGNVTCAVAEDGDRYCWGTDHKDALGLGKVNPLYLPDDVWTDQFDNPTRTPDDDNITWESIGMGMNLSGCGISTNERLYCWGNNDVGQLGLGDKGMRSLPTQVGTSFTQVDGGSGHTCGVKSNGAGYCWGLNSKGQLGIGNTTDKDTPQRVGGSSTQWQEIEAGAGFSCGLRFDNALFCWGWNDKGQLGDNTTTNRTSPHQVA